MKSLLRIFTLASLHSLNKFMVRYDEVAKILLFASIYLQLKFKVALTLERKYYIAYKCVHCKKRVYFLLCITYFCINIPPPQKYSVKGKR